MCFMLCTHRTTRQASGRLFSMYFQWRTRIFWRRNPAARSGVRGVAIVAFLALRASRWGVQSVKTLRGGRLVPASRASGRCLAGVNSRRQGRRRRSGSNRGGQAKASKTPEFKFFNFLRQVVWRQPIRDMVWTMTQAREQWASSGENYIAFHYNFSKLKIITQAF